ncbi:MAG: hypothetical protein ACK553_18415, partial [Planctomycetota bacterium]
MAKLNRILFAVVVLVPVAFALNSMAKAQNPADDAFNAEERLAGYAQREGVTWFIFDPQAYHIDPPQRVVVTGAFRIWSQNMDDPQWQLHRSDGANLWLLAIENPNFETLEPATPFKFRVDAGEWLQPPAESPNREGGNLVFAPGVDPIRMRAEIRTENTL